ncbi:MAG TPA: RNA polymerase sigma factor [Chloroflexia bacterium]
MRESEAVARLKRGDIGGLEALVSLYGVRAVRAAYLICHDRPLSEEIAQAAFLRVYERIEQYDVGRPFAPWFLRGVVNDARKAAVGRERRLPLEEIGEWEEIASDVNIEELALAWETSEAIEKALARLTPGQRSAIVLRYYLDLSESEMAERLAVPPGTVKSRLNSARHRLRQLLPAWIRPGRDDYKKEDTGYL